MSKFDRIKFEESFCKFLNKTICIFMIFYKNDVYLLLFKIFKNSYIYKTLCIKNFIWLNILLDHYYQGSILPSYCTKQPVCFSVNEFKVSKMQLTLVSTSIGALLPPISVRTHPGCKHATKIPSAFRSTLIDFVAALSAACFVSEIR